QPVRELLDRLVDHVVAEVTLDEREHARLVDPRGIQLRDELGAALVGTVAHAQVVVRVDGRHDRSSLWQVRWWSPVVTGRAVTGGGCDAGGCRARGRAESARR